MLNACGDRTVSCDVQGGLNTCICEGTGAGEGTNVTECRYHTLVSPFLWYAACIGAVGAVTVWLMFKLGQFSPKSDRVNIGQRLICCLPRRWRALIHATPAESKSKFVTFYRAYTLLWVSQIVVFGFVVFLTGETPASGGVSRDGSDREAT